jgi:hypothetical protein
MCKFVTNGTYGTDADVRMMGVNDAARMMGVNDAARIIINVPL